MPASAWNSGARKKKRLVQRPIRLALIAFFTAAATAIILSTGAARLLAKARPQTAVAMAPWDARANAELSGRLLQQGKGRHVPRSEELAKSALKRDPTLAVAWRVLAMNMSLGGNSRKAPALFGRIAGMSRRDLPTQLFLLEQRVQADDIPGALRHYDIALKTSPAAAGILLPILARAVKENAVVGPLVDLLGMQPIWMDAFLTQLGASDVEPSAVVQLLTRLRPRVRADTLTRYREIASMLINRGSTEAGREILLLLAPPADTLVRNGDFSVPNLNPPLDWSLSEELHLVAAQEPQQGANGQALSVRASGEIGGEAARQLLRLRAGTYDVIFRYGRIEGSPPAKPFIAVRCATLNPTSLMETNLEVPKAEPHNSQQIVRVPSSCATQWLIFGVRGNFDLGESAVWIDSVRLQPRAN